MPAQLAAGFGRKAFAFDEGLVGNGGADSTGLVDLGALVIDVERWLQT